MNHEFAFAGVVTVLMVGYLVYTLLYPEKF